MNDRVARGAPPSRPPLWLALHFFQLPIDRARDQDDDDEHERARAVVVQHGASRQVLACNAAATEAGVQAGLTLSAAYALVPDLAVEGFDEAGQAEQLHALTWWALGFSSRVTPCPPDMLLLEIGASLRLFGGLTPLLVKVRDSLSELGVSVRRGVAPTPAAARLFARIGQPRPVRDLTRLPLALADVPVARLPLEAFASKGLQQSGIRQLGELMALPPKALARRFGTALSDWLYRLDGRLPDPQTAWQAPETFSHGLDLPLEAPDAGALTFPLNRLFGALGGFLTTKDLGVRRVELQLYHHRLPPTTVALRFLDATADMKHLLRVATERLSGEVLPAPVCRLRVDAPDPAPVARCARDLFDKAAAGGASAAVGSIEQVLDRLTARLGREALYTAMPGDDHRPERAWLQSLLGEQRVPADWPARPLWLYAEPRPAPVALTPSTLPERIENGWWGDTDVRRDYFIAHDAAGSHYWVFRTRHAADTAATNGALWVHGVFA